MLLLDWRRKGRKGDRAVRELAINCNSFNNIVKPKIPTTMNVDSPPQNQTHLKICSSLTFLTKTPKHLTAILCTSLFWSSNCFKIAAQILTSLFASKVKVVCANLFIALFALDLDELLLVLVLLVGGGDVSSVSRSLVAIYLSSLSQSAI